MILGGKFGIVFGVANKRSIAWAIAQAWHKAGAQLAFTYQGERLKDNVEELAGAFGADTPLMECDVTRDDHIARVFDEVGKRFGRLHLLLHSVAFAPKEALTGWLRTAATFNPMTYVLQGMRSLAIDGWVAGDLAVALLVVAALGTFSVSLALMALRGRVG